MSDAIPLGQSLYRIEARDSFQSLYSGFTTGRELFFSACAAFIQNIILISIGTLKPKERIYEVYDIEDESVASVS